MLQGLHCLRSGAVTTIAGVPRKKGYQYGTGTWERHFQDGPGNQAQFAYPNGLVLNPQGQLLVCDKENNRVRAVSLTDGKFTVSTLIGNGEERNTDGPAAKCSVMWPKSIVSDAAGNLFISCGLSVRMFTAATGTSVPCIL